MYAYVNLCRYLRAKYGKSLGRCMIPNHEFKHAVGLYLHINSPEGYYQVQREMKLYGLIRLTNTHVELVSLLD